MITQKKLNAVVLTSTMTLLLLTVAGATGLFAAEDGHPAKPTPIGAWFGVARPCVYPAAGIPTVGGVPVADPAPDPTICGIAGATENLFPLLQVTMIPTLLSDGTVLADDFAELLDHHTTAQGKWESQGKVKVDGKWLEKYQATFIWFSGPLQPGDPAFIGSIRPRFVTFFDKDHPDEMRGYIQPYLYRYTSAADNGLAVDNFDVTGKEVSPSPTDPLPDGCSPTPPVPCLGTLHFYIHRIPSH